MIILSHRGYWLNPSEKNTELAFERSFQLGFGTETDVRDLNGSLVISHDIPVQSPDIIYFRDFLKIYKKYNANLPLAINIKSDGLQQKLYEELKEFDIQNYFVFDMSVPDGLQYFKSDIKVFTRQSEYETKPSYYNQSEGIWLDEFQNHWINQDIIEEHLRNNKKICIVSPDLHKRTYKMEWSDYKQIELNTGNESIMLCTDYPEEARRFYEN